MDDNYDKLLWERWERHYDETRIDSKRICKDGIFDVEKFRAPHNPHILFVLKEVNKFKKGDLRMMLKEGPAFQMWHTIARWSAGLIYKFPEYDEIGKYMKESLSRVAAINLKKASGEAIADMSIINAYAYNDKKFLIEQINQIGPNIIIACGTFDILIWLLNLAINPNKMREPIYDNKLCAWVIPFVHPSRADNKKTYNDLKILTHRHSIL